jgi:TonB family protein
MLAQAAADAVKQWKYKPYVVDGVPVEMETEVSISFRLKLPQSAPPPQGTFRDGTYVNEFFDLEYPLSRDWVRETEAMRKRFSGGGQSSGVSVLLAAVRIPQQTAPLEADSSFVLLAVESGGRGCEEHLKTLGDSFRSQKVAQEKGGVAPLALAGHDYYRADFDFRESPSHRTFLCTPSKEYLLQWNIVGLSKNAVESVIATLNSISATQPSKSVSPQPPAPSPPADAAASTPNKPQVVSVRVEQGVSAGLVIKKVPPVYPPQAKYAHIQGSVLMRAVINKNGDVVDLEVLDGPIELAVSAVNAVRQWKCRPYMLNGEAVEVLTTITVNYVLSGV